MDQQALRLLGFPRVLGIIQTFAQSSLGKAQVLRLEPLTNRREIESRLARLEECRRYIDENDVPPFHRLQDPYPVLENLAIMGQILQPQECLLLLDLLRLGKELKSAFSRNDWPCLAERFENLPSPDQPIREIEQALDPAGEVRETADPELVVSRRKQAQYRKKAQERLQQYFSGSQARFLISEPFLTLRNGRYVIPVKVEHQRDIRGVVYGTSSSGATVFLEPLTAVELNNQHVYYRELEQEIIHRILKRLTQSLQQYQRLMRLVTEKAVELDSLFACGVFANRYRCVAAALNDNRLFRLQDARHPLLVDSLGEDQVVPISIRLSGERNALVISGPNTGGKTVALKTVGLFSVMTQSGLPVPAAEAELAVFPQILADIGDHQSIDEHLSTFSAHVLAIKKMIETLETPSLILLDEVGRGTDPVHGSALGIAVIDFFRQRETLVVATTHHQGVKSFAFSTPEVENASVELDPGTLQPTYRLRYGVAGASSGLEIASQLGVPELIVAAARELLEQREIQAEQYLARLRNELVALSGEKDKLRAQTEELRQREQRLHAEFRQKEKERQLASDRTLRGWEAEFRQETKQFLKTIRDKSERDRMKKEMEQKEARLKQAFRQKMAVRTKEKPSLVRKGDSIFHSFFRKRGVVVSLRNGEATVEIDGKRITAAVDQLEKISEESSPGRIPPNVTLHMVEGKVEPELNLIGSTVDEALMRVDKFLGRAFLSHLSEVSLIHGFGTGRLRAALSEFLQAHPHVSEHRVEGGKTRVTIEE